MNAALFEGAEVQLGAMLAAREARMAAQHGLIKKHNLPVVSFTLNIPGPVKRFALADMLFDSGVDMINRALLSHGIAIADGITARRNRLRIHCRNRRRCIPRQGRVGRA